MQNSRDRLIELIQSAVDGCARHWAGKIADCLIANGVIVPQCKIGDTVYIIERCKNRILPNRENGNKMHIIEDKIQMIGFSSKEIHIRLRNHKNFNKTYVLNKSAFITREQAEKALERSKDNA